MESNSGGGSDVEMVERAMVAIRRRQARRSIARLDTQGRARGGGDGATPTVSATVDVLDVIEAAEQAGIPATVARVAVALSVDQPRASKLVAAAVEAGLVRREADQGDGRRSLLAPTDAGRAVTEQVHEFRRSVFSSAMSDWSERDRKDFARLLTRFVEALAQPPG